MAVRVTAGRIWVAALLAVAMSVAVHRIENFSSQTASLTAGDCGDDGYRHVTFDITPSASRPSAGDTPNVHPGVTPTVSGGSFCKRTCDAAKASGEPINCEPGSCLQGGSCQLECITVSGGQSCSVFDEPTGDNSGVCTVTYSYYDPTCSGGTGGGGGSSAGVTSSTGGGSSGGGGGSSTGGGESSASAGSSSSGGGSSGGGGSSTGSSHSTTSSTSWSSTSHSSASWSSASWSSTSWSSTSWSSTSWSSSWSSYSSSWSSSIYSSSSWSGSSTSSSWSSASSSPASSSSSSSSSTQCGDGVVQETGPGPDGISGNDDDMEQCDDGNTVNNDGCTNACTVPRCGDGIRQPNGPNGVPDGASPFTDDEECDHGEDNTGAGPLTESWCSLSCKLPECSNGRDQHDVGVGAEDIPDGDADDGDGGCYQVICNKNGSPYLPGKNDENNPCAVAAPPFEMGTGTEGSSGGSGGSPGETSGGGGESPGEAANLLAAVGAACAKAPGAPVAGGGGCAPDESCRVLFPGGPTGCRPLLPEGAGCANNFDCADGAQCISNGGPGTCTPVAPGQEFPVCPPGVVGGGECGDGQADPGEMCDDGNDVDNDACANDCTVPGAARCGDGVKNGAEECDDGNGNNADLCSNTCENVVGGQCKGNECGAGGDAFCELNEVCEHIDALPCIKCTPKVGGVCTGNECAEGGAIAAVEAGMECSLLPDFPCVTFIPKNSCGNGRIDPLEPPEVEEGCQVTGASNQLCLPEGSMSDESTEYQPWFACFQGANCVQMGGGCGWEMTPEVLSCIQRNADAPLGADESNPDGGPQVFDAFPSPSILLAQVGNTGTACTRDIPFCGCDSEGNMYRGPRGIDCDPVCPEGVSMDNCPQGGTACQPYICSDGRSFPTCKDDGTPINYFTNPCDPPAPGAPGGSCNDPMACTKDTQNCCNADGDVVGSSVRDSCDECRFTACPAGSSHEQCTQENVCMRCGMQGEICTFVGADCAAPGGISQENSCYDSASCEWNGTRCAWADTEELAQCLKDNAGGSCPTGQSCMTASACGDSDGSPGVSCGADGTKVCCTTTDEPLEDCDDGNRIDDDACSNECTRNCRTHSDCPEGACVEGTCTDQCVDPALALRPAAPPASRAGFFTRIMAGNFGAPFTLLP